MKIKLKALHDSYGFLGRYHYKNDIVEIDSHLEFPIEHFEIIEGKQEKKEEKKSKPHKTN